MGVKEKLVDAINNFFGCDAAYFDVNPFDLADHLIANGVTVQETTQLFCTGNDEYYGPWGNCRKCGAENICGSKFCQECGAKIEVEI